MSAESFDPNKLKEILSQLSIVPKSPEVGCLATTTTLINPQTVTLNNEFQFTTVLRKTLTRSPMLRALDVEQKEAIVRAFAGPNIYVDGQDVIVQVTNTITLSHSRRVNSDLLTRVKSAIHSTCWRKGWWTSTSRRRDRPKRCGCTHTSLAMPSASWLCSTTLLELPPAEQGALQSYGCWTESPSRFLHR